MSWYYYLEDKLHFPFLAKCTAERSMSPLQIGEEVEVIGLPPETECEHEMFVKIKWSGRELAVPLSQLQRIENGKNGESDKETQQAIEDWHYWVGSGYEF